MKQILKYLQREHQYYPTPEKLVEDILSELTSSMRYGNWPEEINFLEPCAGDGAIAKTVRTHFKEGRQKININCIEIEPILRDTLAAQDFNIAGTDFDKFHSHPFYDLIIMNPPFSKGAGFLLKAYDLLAGKGQLVCILNAETIKNPFTNERKRLADLIERTGEVEFIKDAFNTSSSNKKTDVEIAVVYLNKPVYEDEFDAFGNLQRDILTEDEKILEELKEKITGSELMTFDKVENAISIYRNAVSQIFKGIDTVEQIRNSLLYLEKESQEFNIKTSAFMKIILENKSADAKEQSIKTIRKMIWSYVLTACKMDKYLFYRQRQKLYENLDKGSGTLPFTKENIRQFFDNLFLMREEYYKEGIQDLFNEITSYHHGNKRHEEGWKTNKNWKINSKIIVKWGAFEFTDYSKYGTYHGFDGSSYTAPKYGEFKCRCYEKNWIDDLDKIVRKIQPENSNGMTIKEALNNKFNELGKVYIGEKFDNAAETPYFHLKFWKKGTLHITFKDQKVLDELNLIGAKLRRDLGYDDYGKKPGG